MLSSSSPSPPQALVKAADAHVLATIFLAVEVESLSAPAPAVALANPQYVFCW